MNHFLSQRSTRHAGATVGTRLEQPSLRWGANTGDCGMQNQLRGGASVTPGQPPLPATLPNRLGWMLATAPARGLADYYLAHRGEAAMLSRSRFNPADLKPILPRVVLLELRSEKEIRIRLAGTCLTGKVGRELAGLNWLDLIAPEHRATRAAAYAGLAETQSGLRAAIRYPSTLGEDMLVECLTLPMTPARADEPALAIGVLASLWRPAGARPLPFLRGSEELTPLPLEQPQLH